MRMQSCGSRCPPSSRLVVLSWIAVMLSSWYSASTTTSAVVRFVGATTTTKTTTITREESMRQKQRLVDWLRERGGYYSPKLSFQPLHTKDDLVETGGIFAHQDIAKGERLMYIPADSLYGPPKTSNNFQDRICRTAQRLVEDYQTGQKAVAAARTQELPEFWPYVQYVFESFAHAHLPAAWSQAGKAIVHEMVGKDALDPENFGHFQACTKYYKKKHDDDDDSTNEDDDGDDNDDDDNNNVEEYNQLLDAARRIVDSRGWYQILVPVFDMGNHRNGIYHNMDQKYDSATHDDFEMVARRDVTAGEELYLSYNECPDYTCRGAKHSYVTPELFKDYGFVENYPQRWKFFPPKPNGEDGTSKVLFEVDLTVPPPLSPQKETRVRGGRRPSSDGRGEGASSAFQVTWISNQGRPPRSHERKWLHGQLTRLQQMRDHVQQVADQLPSHERYGVTAYYQALQQALALAIGVEPPPTTQLQKSSDLDSKQSNDDHSHPFDFGTAEQRHLELDLLHYYGAAAAGGSGGGNRSSTNNSSGLKLLIMISSLATFLFGVRYVRRWCINKSDAYKR